MPVDSSRKEANKNQSGVGPLINAFPDVSICTGRHIRKIPAFIGRKQDPSHILIITCCRFQEEINLSECF